MVLLFTAWATALAYSSRCALRAVAGGEARRPPSHRVWSRPANLALRRCAIRRHAACLIQIGSGAGAQLRAGGFDPLREAMNAAPSELSLVWYCRTSRWLACFLCGAP